MATGTAAAALAALQSGLTADALSIIERGVETGDPEALFTLGLWRIEGRWLPRDLALAREAMRQAADAGSMPAARIHAGMLAAGVGGARDWHSALISLEDWSKRDPMADAQLRMLHAMDLDSDGNPACLPDREILCRDPFIYRVPKLLTAGECALLVSLARPRLKPAQIFHESQKRFVVDPLRTSHAAGFPVTFEWPFVHALNRRFAAASRTDTDQGEPLQLLRYRPGEEYRPHLDAIAGLSNQRIWTVLTWLGQDFSGGQTHFSKLNLSIAGQRGDTLVFANAIADGRPDPRTEHAGLPVITGEKLLASRWVRAAVPNSASGFGAHEAESR